MLLEILSDFQISIPELGPRRRAHPPDRAADLQQHARAHRGAQAPLPVPVARLPAVEHELAIVKLHTPDLSDQVAAKLVEVVAMVRELDLKKPPSIAESIDWARALLLLGADDIDAQMFKRDDVGDRQAPHRPRHRSPSALASSSRERPVGPAPEPAVAWQPAVGSPGSAPARIADAQLIGFRGAARARASRSAPPSCWTPSTALAEVPWTMREDFREALAATLAKSPEDRRVFELVFERFFFRAAEARRHADREGVRGAGQPGEGEGDGGGQRRRPRPRRAARAIAARDRRTATRARCATSPGWRSPRSDARRGLGRDRRRRAAHPPLARACAPSRSPSCPRSDPRRDGLPRERLRRFEQLLRRELERGQIERTRQLPPSRPLNELDRSLPSGPLQDLAAVHRVVAQLKRRLATQGNEQRGRRRHAPSTCAARCAPRCRPAACPSSCKLPPAAARAARRSSCCATSRPA